MAAFSHNNNIQSHADMKNSLYQTSSSWSSAILGEHIEISNDLNFPVDEIAMK